MNKARIKALFSKINLEEILWSLWAYKDRIQISPIQCACITSVSTEFCNPGPYANTVQTLPETVFLNLVHAATTFCLNSSSEGKDLKKGKNIIYFMLQLASNQCSLQRHDPAEFTRALVIFNKIPNQYKSKSEDLKYDLPKLFKDNMGYSIVEYIQTCFIAFAAINSHGKFTDNYLLEAEKLDGFPSYEIMNSILGDISFSAKEYRNSRRELNESNRFDYHPLLMRPLIKLWPDASNVSFEKRYIAPIPWLIADKARSGIYHHFLSNLGKPFTDFYGKEFFEHYIERVLKHCRNDSDKLINDDDLKSDLKPPKGVPIPDFLYLSNEVGLIIECKAARIPLPVMTKGRKEDYKSSLDKLTKAVEQVSEFSRFASEQNIYGVKAWHKLIVTDEPLWGMSGEGFVESLVGEFLKGVELTKFCSNIKDVTVLSIGELDQLQIHTSSTHTLLSIYTRLHKASFVEILNQLKDETGRSFEDSHLYSDFYELESSLGMPNA